MLTKKKLVFIVDDDEMLSMMLYDHLQKFENIEIITFETGEQCLEKLYLKPEVIILDFNLNSIEPSAKNGIEILKEIKSITPEILVVMYSSQEQTGNSLEIIKHFKINYVLKNNHAFTKIDQILTDYWTVK